jgi:hypothetical protein
MGRVGFETFFAGASLLLFHSRADFAREAAAPPSFY